MFNVKKENNNKTEYSLVSSPFLAHSSVGTHEYKLTEKSKQRFFLFSKQINRFHFAVTRPCCGNNPFFILYCLLAFRPRILSYTFVYSFVWSGIKSRFYKTAIFLTFNRSSVLSSRFFINCTTKASKYRFILPSNTFFCFPSLMTN